ncbi:cytosolic sulfotransferase 8-like [Oryza brachyantha]|uniref:cytosolic sulfotransferase 8-like n=1 Tax=Oryza brachyantha TaxID=4533 RepID=UPI001ADD006D|nr:cytosolic sulfotransferase 8-like [Oryza brachyantha]
MTNTPEVVLASGGAPPRHDGRAAGPVAFKDAVAATGDVDAAPLEQYDAVVSAMPARVFHSLKMRQNQGYWVLDAWARGAVAMQRGGFVPRAAGDVLLASLPKSGTTWLKALAFATMARRASPPASPDHPLRRLNPHDCVPLLDRLFALGRGAVVDELPSPRLMCTHMALSLLPPTVADGTSGCKIIYICRDQKDALVSMWHFLKRNGLQDLSLQETYDSFCDGTCFGGPVWDHMLEYWKASNEDPARVLFLRYEQVLQDPAGTVRELARFVGQPFTGAEEDAGAVADIVELCSLESLRSQRANREGAQGVFVKFSHESYFRKGVAGDWMSHMSPEMGERLDAILRDRLDGSGLVL